MLQILSITIPIYLIIGLGFVAARWQLFAQPDMRALSRFVVNFCLPALLFRALSQRRLGEVFDGVYLLAYALGSLLVLLGATACIRLLRGKPMPLAALHGLGMAGSNSAFIGYPIALQLLGPAAGVALALTMVVENLMVLPLALVLADSSSALRWDRALLQSLRGLLRNPMILAIIAGVAFALSGLQLPDTLARTIQIVAGAASPVALFVIGGSLVGLRLQGLHADIAIVVTGKLLLHPLAVFALLWLLPPLDAELRAAAVVYACMPMLSIYPLLAQKYQAESFSAAALLVATVASFATITAWLAVLHSVLNWTD